MASEHNRNERGARNDMNALMDDMSKTGAERTKHTKSHKCTCTKCASQFNGDIMPQRKTLCPVDKHMNSVM